MKRKLTLGIMCFIMTITIIFAIPKMVNSQNLITQGIMGGGMRGGGMMGGDMRTIHQLFANHNLIDRKVEEIPGGIRAITESENPQIAALIKTHVAKMYQRMDNNQGIPMMMMSSTLPTMAENSDRYNRELKITSKGIVVTETSNDPDMISVIRDHAQEINQFVKEGMPNMGGGMMNN